jgi:hypothetical protein
MQFISGTPGNFWCIKSMLEIHLSLQAWTMQQSVVAFATTVLAVAHVHAVESVESMN